MDGERFDHVVLGGGLSGLGAALRLRRDHPAATLLVVDAAPRAGGNVQTLRSNGFVCELGPFAFARDEIAPLLERLPRPPRPVEPLATGCTGHRFDGHGLQPIDVDPTPVSFATGTEELVQACRRELGQALRLGRAATRIETTTAGWRVQLGGESESHILAGHLTLALPTADTARLLAPFDAELPGCADRLDTAPPRAFVFFGGHGSDAPELRGYGIVPADAVETPCAEMVFCTQVFAQRALAGRFLVRVELAGETADAVRTAEAELRRWTGTRAPMPFTKVHAFSGPGDPATTVECRTRSAAIAARLDSLQLG